MHFEQALHGLRNSPPGLTTHRRSWRGPGFLHWDGDRIEFCGVAKLSEDDLNAEDWVLERAPAETQDFDPKAILAELEAMGWRWGGEGGNYLSNPLDPDWNVWRRPETGEVVFSPQLVERILSVIQEERP